MHLAAHWDAATRDAPSGEERCKMNCRQLLRVLALVVAMPFATSCSGTEEDRTASPVVTIRASETEVTPMDPVFEDDEQGEGPSPVEDVGVRDSRPSGDEDCGCDVAMADTGEPDPVGGG